MRIIENIPNDNTARNYTYHEHADVSYAATINLPVMKGVNEQDVYVAQLTGNATVNLPDASKVNLLKGDKINLIFVSDGSARTITWGSNIKAPAATLVTIANGGNLVRGMWNGTSLILNQ